MNSVVWSPTKWQPANLTYIDFFTGQSPWQLILFFYFFPTFIFPIVLCIWCISTVNGKANVTTLFFLWMPINTSTVQAVTNKTTAHNSHICTDVEVIRYRNSAGQILVVQTICIHTELCSRNAPIPLLFPLLFPSFLEFWPCLFLCSFPPSKNPKLTLGAEEEAGIDKNDLAFQSLTQ